MSKLQKVFIYPNYTAKMCEETINSTIESIKDTDYELSYELLIENSVCLGTAYSTTYTLLINIEEPDILDDDSEDY